MQVLQWTQDQGVAQRLAWRVAECLAQELQQLSKPRQGVQEWLTALARASVPCAVVSTLDRHVPPGCAVQHARHVITAIACLHLTWRRALHCSYASAHSRDVCWQDHLA